MTFNHTQIEKKWQKKWAETRCFEAQIDYKKKKFYALDMFPYPSGAGLHVGHLVSYTPTDIVSRYKRTQGFNVLHPMGYDAFGLPAEQYAIKTGIHPAQTTQKAILNFKKQLKSFGFSFDWSREVSTCDPNYYKWTQKIFLIFFKNKLAYRKKTPVNWCPELRTILANEEVVNGQSERGGHPVFQKKINQWILKITQYANSLLQGLDSIDWPESTKEGQRNWIGKSEGLCIDFNVENSNKKILIFTTRPDTIFGSSFLVLSPEHPLIEEEFSKNKEYSKIKEYQKKSQSISEVDKKKQVAETGVFSGSYALHPLTQKKIPIWIADYVLMDYGSGAIMAVPAHDERDFIFARKFNLPIQPVIQTQEDSSQKNSSQENSSQENSSQENSSQENSSQKNPDQEDSFQDGELPFCGKGVNIHSDFLNGLSTEESIEKMKNFVEEKKIGYSKVQYKLRDWIFSRQRYWGEPFPLVYLNSTVQAVPDFELPVTLPETAHYEPSQKGEPPLARVKNFVNYTSTQGEKGQRETDTMPGTAASSWYFLRYTDPHNTKEPFSFEAQKYWMPVDLYIGGSEHTVSHLLYARFWQQFLYDQGLVSHKEPFKKLAHQGVVLASDGLRMSKSVGNTVSVDDLCKEYGADTTRLYISFLGPFDKSKPWSDQGIGGCRRFLERLWRLCFNEDQKDITHQNPPSKKLNRIFNQTIKKVTEDIESMNFNTAISALMILVNEMYLEKSNNRFLLQTISQLLQPFAPHISEEIWSKLGGKNLVCLEPWPTYNSQSIQEDTIHLAVQINGKKRGIIEVTPTASEQEALETARKIKNISNILETSSIKKVIYKPGRILNIVSQK